MFIGMILKKCLVRDVNLELYCSIIKNCLYIIGLCLFNLLKIE